MPVVNPGIRRFLGSAIQRLFNSASVSLPLTHTAVPTRGSITPTFTRATTATGQRWDEAGYLDFTALAGEIVWKGARRVRNLISTTSEDFSAAAWTKANTTVVANQAVAPNGTLTADLVHPASTGTDRDVYQNGLVASVVGNKHVLEGYAKYSGIQWLWFGTLGGGTTAALLPFFDLQNGVVGQTGTYFNSSTIEDVGDGWYRCTATKNALITATLFPVYGLGDADGSTTVTANGTDGIYLWGAQLEYVTGQTTQTASEYVSVGVESAPAYHGSMVDGVKCYDTDRSGNPISTSGSYPLVGYVPWEARTNIALQSNAFTTTWAALSTPSITQNVIGPDGATSAWTITDDSAVAREGIYQSVALTAATHTFSIFVKKTTGVQTNYPVLFMFPALTSLAAVTIDTTNGVVTPWTAYTGFSGVSCSATCVSHNASYWRVAVTFTGTAAAWEIDIYPAATSNPTQSTGTIDVTVQGSAVFYGAMVNLGAFAGPYQPTTTVAVARNASVESVTTSGAILAAGGTISLTYIPYHAPSGTIALWGTYVDASNYTAILHDATNLIFRKRIAGVNYDATIANAFTSGTTYKMAASWGAGGSTIYLNGVAGTPHANTTAAQIAATMQVGADGNSLQQPGAGTTNLRIWQRQLSSPEGVAVTA